MYFGEKTSRRDIHCWYSAFDKEAVILQLQSFTIFEEYLQNLGLSVFLHYLINPTVPGVDSFFITKISYIQITHMGPDIMVIHLRN